MCDLFVIVAFPRLDRIINDEGEVVRVILNYQLNSTHREKISIRSPDRLFIIITYLHMKVDELWSAT